MKILVFIILFLLNKSSFAEEIKEELFSKDKDILNTAISLFEKNDFSISVFQNMRNKRKIDSFHLQNLGNKIYYIEYYTHGGYTGIYYTAYYFNEKLIKMKASISKEDLKAIDSKLKEDTELYEKFAIFFKNSKDIYIFEQINIEIEHKMKKFVRDNFGTFEEVYFRNSEDKKLYNTLISYDTDLPYGYSCGGIGSDIPDGRIALEKLLIYRDKKIFLNVLKGYNNNGKAYALEGIYRLKKEKIKLLKSEEKLIKKIIDSRAIITTCSGCIYRKEKIKIVYEDMKKYRR